MRNAPGNIAARVTGLLALLALTVGLAAPALCAATRAETMPCCKERGDCERGLGRPSCCAQPEADGGSPASQAATAVGSGIAPAAATLLPAAVVAPLPSGIAPGAVEAVHATDSPPLFLLHSVFLC